MKVENGICREPETQGALHALHTEGANTAHDPYFAGYLAGYVDALLRRPYNDLVHPRIAYPVFVPAEGNDFTAGYRNGFIGGTSARQ